MHLFFPMRNGSRRVPAQQITFNARDPDVNNPPASGEWINGSSTQRRASVSKPPIQKTWYQ